MAATIFNNKLPPVLLLPGWQNSGPGHWQRAWQARWGDVWVEQHDWLQPRRGDWIARLEDVILAQAETPVLLAAHSLGCHLVAAWAAHSQHTSKVCGALLVAPADTTRPELATRLPTWSVPVLRPLPFAATLLYSQDDPYCSPQQSLNLARAWGAHALDQGARGHLNAESGLGDWPQARALLQALARSGSGRTA
ncbi:MAG: alpha/beta hydrolase [Rhodoferax sp.]